MNIKKNLFLSIIPARGGSKGLPGKNIKILGDKPLIAHTILAALNSKYINKTIVSTDDKEIAKFAKEFGAEVPFMRPSNLADDNASTVNVVMHTIDYLISNSQEIPEFIVLLQPTSPFRDQRHIDEAINLAIKSEKDAIVSVCEVASNPYWMLKINENKLEYFIEEGKKITKRQDLPKFYEFNGAIYIIKTEVFIKEKTFEPENLGAYIMDSKYSIDIDEELDFKFAELVLKEGKL